MAVDGRGGARWAVWRNLSGGVAGLAAALVALAQAAHAAAVLQIVPAGAGLVSALVFVVFRVLESRGDAHPVLDLRPIPRAELDVPQKFVNRRAELAQLDAAFERMEADGRPVTVVLGGLPGVGKSAVGRYWASRARERFSGGDLVADFSARRRGGVVDVSSVLADFLRQIGPADAVIPATLAERVSRYRSLTQDRRMLVLLDDVSEPAHVTQLRPSGVGSMVIATSYRSMEELLYGGADYVPIDPLPAERARHLLVKMAGDVGWAFEQDEAGTAELVRLAGGLALPLCVCATRLMLGRGARTVASIAAEVAAEDRRLEYLSGKGEYAGAAVFGYAYAELSGDEQLLYRRIAIHPGGDIAPAHAALLSGLALGAADALLQALADTHLLEPHVDGRYRFHDLVRLHARERLHEQDPEPDRERALSGLVDWYLAALEAADRVLVPERLRIGEPSVVEVAHRPMLADRDAAFAWLESERANVMALLHAARDREWDDRAWRMVEALWLFFYNRRHYADWIDATQLGIECAQRAGHRDAQARLRSQLAWALTELGDEDRARRELDRANRLVLGSSNIALRASVLEFTGTCHLKRGDFDAALEALDDARTMFLQTGSPRAVALQDYFIGWALLGRDECAVARESLEAALRTMREVDDQMFVGRSLLRLGQAATRLGEPAEAERRLVEARALFVALGLRLEEAEASEALAAVAELGADHQRSAALREHAWGLYEALGDPRGAALDPGAPGLPVDIALR